MDGSINTSDVYRKDFNLIIRKDGTKLKKLCF